MGNMIPFIDYKVAEGDDPEHLAKQVIKLMNDGYMPLGGVAVSVAVANDDYGRVYCQAMLLPRYKIPTEDDAEK